MEYTQSQLCEERSYKSSSKLQLSRAGCES